MFLKLLNKFFNSTKIFIICFATNCGGYIIRFVISFTLLCLLFFGSYLGFVIFNLYFKDVWIYFSPAKAQPYNPYLLAPAPAPAPVPAPTSPTPTPTDWHFFEIGVGLFLVGVGVVIWYILSSSPSSGSPSSSSSSSSSPSSGSPSSDSSSSDSSSSDDDSPSSSSFSLDDSPSLDVSSVAEPVNFLSWCGSAVFEVVSFGGVVSSVAFTSLYNFVSYVFTPTVVPIVTPTVVPIVTPGFGSTLLLNMGDFITVLYNWVITHPSLMVGSCAYLGYVCFNKLYEKFFNISVNSAQRRRAELEHRRRRTIDRRIVRQLAAQRLTEAQALAIAELEYIRRAELERSYRRY